MQVREPQGQPSEPTQKSQASWCISVISVLWRQGQVNPCGLSAIYGELHVLKKGGGRGWTAPEVDLSSPHIKYIHMYTYTYTYLSIYPHQNKKTSLKLNISKFPIRTHNIIISLRTTMETIQI